MKKTLLLKKFTNLVHYDKPYNSLPCLIIVSICLLGSLNSLMVVLMERNNFEKRLSAANDFVLTVILISMTVERSLKPHKTSKLLQLIENEFLVNRYELSDQKWEKFEMYYKKTETEMEKTEQSISTVFVIMCLGYICRNIINQFLRDLIGYERSSTDLPVPFTYWDPEGQNSYGFFAYLYILHSFRILIYTTEVYCVQIAVSLSTKRLLADFQTIYILINDLAKDFPEVGIYDGISRELDQHHKNGNGNYNYGEHNDTLKRDMMRIVRCHQSLIRNFKDCEMSSGFALILISLVVFIDTCTEFYVVMKADNLITALNYGMSSLMINLAVLYPYHTGQRIADQNDILRQQLSNIPWIDKPKWFKNTLHIMMIRANVDIVMKPFGVHYLNHVSFKNMIRVSSSFGNFLYNTRLENS